MSTIPEPPPKKEVMLALLERSSVFIHLDPRKDEVRVPPWFKKQPQLVLQVGLNMAVRIPDLDVGDDAVSCTLSFNRSPVFCYMPWSAVFALVAEDGKGMIWPNDIPKEVAAQQAEQVKKEQAKAQIHAVPASAPASVPASVPSAEPAASTSGVGAPAAKPAKADPAKRGGKKRSPARLRAEKPPEDAPPPPTAPTAPGASDAEARSGRAGGTAGATPPSRPSGPRGDGKRPLPSYLRVVK